MAEEYIRRSVSRGAVPFGDSVLFLDDFSGLNNYTVSGTGGDEFVEIDPNIAYIGKHSLHMKTRVTGAAANDFLFIDRSTFLPPSKIALATFIWYSPLLAQAVKIGFTIAFYDGAILHEAVVYHYPASNKWFQVNLAGAEVEIAGSELDLSVAAWHRIRLAANFATGKYLYMQSDHVNYDLSALAFKQSVAVSESRLVLRPYIRTVGGFATDIYLGSIFMTEH